MEQLAQVLTRGHADSADHRALVILDLDCLHMVNESLGSLLGDQLLLEVTRRLQICLGSSALVRRLGGDEFALVIESRGDEENIQRQAQRLFQFLAQPYDLCGHEVGLTVSMGIVADLNDYACADDALHDAEAALYRAKASGKASAQVFDTEMRASMIARIQREADLRRAINDGAFELHYQPIVAARTGQVIGFEALVRWRDSQRGLMGPGDFIPLAEETGLIISLGEWILRAACVQLKSWQDARLPPWYVAVNISPRQLDHPDRLARIGDIIRETGIDAHRLKLELTEGCLMAQGEEIIGRLCDLTALGVQFAIDDFGTGYSSLSYLKKLPVACVKIDRSFVRDITSNRQDAAIATAVTAIAHSLDLMVVAEGVETEAQLAVLQGQACDALQGYLFSPPMPAGEIAVFAQQQERTPGPCGGRYVEV